MDIALEPSVEGVPATAVDDDVVEISGGSDSELVLWKLRILPY